jgi:cytochrome b6-f complex iron-sulfur subunit
MKKSETWPCSRRELIKGLGLLALPLPLGVLSGCGPTGGGTSTGVTSPNCSAQVCLDLSQSANVPLQSVGGALQVDHPDGDTLILVRTSQSAVVALSAVCTHAGCLVSFDSQGNDLACPCHGSLFNLDGSVQRGPASVPLKAYTATLSGNQVTIG